MLSYAPSSIVSEPLRPGTGDFGRAGFGQDAGGVFIDHDVFCAAVRAVENKIWQHVYPPLHRSVPGSNPAVHALDLGGQHLGVGFAPHIGVDGNGAVVDVACIICRPGRHSPSSPLRACGCKPGQMIAQDDFLLVRFVCSGLVQRGNGGGELVCCVQPRQRPDRR